MSCGACHMPMSAEATAPAMPATVAWAAAAGPAANGPMSGERKPKTPANVSAAEERIDRTIAAPCAPIEAAAPASSALARAATPVAVAAVFIASARTSRSTVASHHSMNLISKSSSTLLNAACQFSVPDSSPRNCELKAPMIELAND